MPKKKANSIGKLVNQAADLLQLLRRLEEADDNGYCKCCTCDAVRYYKDGMQGGHFISRGKSATKLLKRNVHPQCDGCNGFGMKFHNKEAVYTLFMEDKYGREFVDELIYKSKQVHKWNRCEVEYLIAEFKKEIKFHEDRVA